MSKDKKITKDKNLNLNKIKKILTEQKTCLKEKYMVTEIGIFGSYVRGNQKKDSDIDIIVDFEKVPGLFKFSNMANYLENLLGRKVDLVPKQ